MLAGLDGIGGFISATSEGGGTSGSLAVSVSPTSLSRTSSTTGGSRTLTTSNSVATPSGGSGVYNHSWTRVFGDAAITAVSPSAASTTFTGTLAAEDSFYAQFVDTVTDDAGNIVVSDPVNVTLTLILSGGHA